MKDGTSRYVDTLLGRDKEFNRINKITEKIIGCAFKVSNTLGTGFLEKVYENSLAIELSKHKLHVERQKPIDVFYEKEVVGSFFADLLVEDEILIELKHARNLDPAHKAQCLNYLRATDLRLCLLINFGKPKIEIKRISN
ncbi:MAG: GxxExxY protein [Acidobacteria bacterium]|nr:MAG: GxxExxY protein [Acidobacteriota bacterium]REK02724.1 MAG: GxxExxY protein [Acidobacteriota bacterium]REK13471.1 MAG: GxxExxY protein [Acidobacteriota bacterium]REK41465.1 MAG: GxxExxY protein [Acidobacteriota bacterium]